MALSKAEERRRRFLANKEKFEGNYYELVQKAEYEKDPTVYFLDDGTILQRVTKEQIEPQKEW